MQKHIFFFISFVILHFTVYTQNRTSQSDSVNSKKLTGMVMAFTDVTFTKINTYTSSGIGGALRINDKFYIGVYGLGLMSKLKSSDFNTIKEIVNFHVSYSQGGICMGYINSDLRNISLSLSLKAGYGSIFLYNPQYVINYDFARDELLIINPSFDTEVFITNWLKFNIGFGIRFIHGLSSKYYDKNGVQTLYYKSSALEGGNISFSLFFGSFNKY